MNRFEAIIAKYESDHGVKVGCYDFRSYYDGRSFLDLHIIGEELNKWHAVNIETETEEEIRDPGTYYIRGREIADRLVKEALKANAAAGDDFISDQYESEIEKLTEEETEEEAKKHVLSDKDFIEYAICESCMGPDELFNIMAGADGYKQLDHLGLYHCGVDVVSHAIKEAEAADLKVFIECFKDFI